MQDSKGKRGTSELAISLSLSTTPMVRKSVLISRHADRAMGVLSNDFTKTRELRTPSPLKCESEG